MVSCASRQLAQSLREAAFSSSRNAGAHQAIRPFTGPATPENLVDYLNREVYPVLKQARKAVNDVYRPVLDNAPSGNPLRYFFSDSTVNADPTTGFLRLDNADATAATTIRVSESNAGLQNIVPWLDVMAGSSTSPLGVVTLFHAADPTRFARYDLSAMTDQGTYWDLAITFVEASGTNPFLDGDGVVLAFIPGVASSGATPIGANELGVVSHVGGNVVSSVTRLAFSNSNNVSWTLSTAASAATVLGSVALQTGISAWRLSNMVGSQTGSITNATDTIATSGTIFVEAATDTLNSINNVKFRLSGNSLYGAANIGAIAGTLAITSGFAPAFVLSNSNNVSFGASTLTLAGIGRLVAITGTATVASTQGSIRLSAGTTSVLSSAFTFSNSNNVSFGMDTNGVVTGTATVASSLTNIRVSAGTTSTLASAFTFQNSNAISFGLNGAVITAIANSGISAVGGGTLSINNGLSGLAFLDSNNVSWTLSTNAGTPGNGTIVASATVASTQGSIRISAGTTSVLSSGFTFSNSNNVSFGINAGVVTATATVAATDASIGLVSHVGGNTVASVSRLAFSNASNVTFSLSTAANAATLLASVNTGGGGIAIANSGVTASTGTVEFSNATILTNGAASASLPNVVFGLTGQTMQATALIRVQTGTNSTLSGGFQVTKVQFMSANNISFGMDSTNDADGRVAVITASAGNPALSYYGHTWASGSNLVQYAGGDTGSYLIAPFRGGEIFPANMTANTIELLVLGSPGTNASSSFTYSVRGGLYSLNNSTQLTLVNSFIKSSSAGSAATSARNASWAGNRWLTIGTADWSSNPVFSEGVQYWMAFNLRTSGPGGIPQGLVFRQAGLSLDAGNPYQGEWGQSTSTANSRIGPFWGPMSGTTNPPGSIALSQILTNGSSAYLMNFQMRNNIGRH